MKTFPDIISQWPSHSALAADVGTRPNNVALWNHRGSIPPEYWHDLVKSKVAKTNKITLEVLAKLCKDKRG